MKRLIVGLLVIASLALAGEYTKSAYLATGLADQYVTVDINANAGREIHIYSIYGAGTTATNNLTIQIGSEAGVTTSYQTLGTIKTGTGTSYVNGGKPLFVIPRSYQARFKQQGYNDAVLFVTYEVK